MKLLSKIFVVTGILLTTSSAYSFQTDIEDDTMCHFLKNNKFVSKEPCHYATVSSTNGDKVVFNTQSYGSFTVKVSSGFATRLRSENTYKLSKFKFSSDGGLNMRLPHNASLLECTKLTKKGVEVCYPAETTMN